MATGGDRFFRSLVARPSKSYRSGVKNKISLANKHATKNRENLLVSETGSDGPQLGATSLHQSPPVSKS